MSVIERLPEGFLSAGRNVGIKNSKRDLGLLISDGPATLAACVSSNMSRAPCVRRTIEVLALDKPVRAIVTVSGNANALTGDQGKEDDEALARAVAKQLSIAPEEVLTASTGVLGHRLPLGRIIEGIQPVLSGLSR